MDSQKLKMLRFGAKIVKISNPRKYLLYSIMGHSLTYIYIYMYVIRTELNFPHKTMAHGPHHWASGSGTSHPNHCPPPPPSDHAHPTKPTCISLFRHALIPICPVFVLKLGRKLFYNNCFHWIDPSFICFSFRTSSDFSLGQFAPQSVHSRYFQHI